MTAARLELPPLYVFGDLLGDSAEACAWRRVLSGLGPEMHIEARRFWPEATAIPPSATSATSPTSSTSEPNAANTAIAPSTAQSGELIELHDGAKTWTTRSFASASERERIEAAADCVVPIGSPLVAIGDDPRLAALARAQVPEAGPVLVCPLAAASDTTSWSRWVMAQLPKPPLRELVFVAPVLGPSGYAAEGRVMFEALERDPGVRVCLRPLRFGSAACAEDRDFLELVRDASAREPRGNYDALHLVFPTQFQADPRAQRNILRTMYETDRVPDTWLAGIEAADEVWVPSTFHLRSFAKAGFDASRLRVVPETVDAAFAPSAIGLRPSAANAGPHGVAPPDATSGSHPMRFLSIFDWSHRKAPELLLESFGRAFAEGEAELLLKVHSSLGRSAEELHELAHEALARGAARADHAAPRLEFVEGHFAPSRMPALYAQADAFVLCSRGEGWGRPVHEALAMGLPVVAPCAGGLTDLLGGRSVAYPVAGRVVPCDARAIAEVPELAGHSWFEPDGDDLVRQLRAVHANPNEARARGERGRRWVRSRFDYAPSKLSDALEHGKREATPHTASPRVRVVFEGPLFSKTSYAGITRQLVRGLRDDPRLECLVRSLDESGAEVAIDDEILPYCTELDTTADICLRSGWPPSPSRPNAKYWIQRVDWEYGVPPRWLASSLANGPDEIWVHSRAVERCLLAGGVPKRLIQLVPHTVDETSFHPGVETLPELRDWSRDRFVFLFVGGAIWRKGIDLLLRAWLEAFSRDDPVCMLVRSSIGSEYAGQGLADTLRRLAQRDDIAEIRLVEELDDRDIARLYASADCLVHPFRGEGFGLPLLEARACGLPIVMTAGGAPDDFLDPRGVIRIPAQRRETVLDEDCVGRPWILEPDYDALLEALIAVPRRIDDLGDGAREAATDMAARAARSASRTAIAERFVAIASSAASRSRDRFGVTAAREDR